MTTHSSDFRIAGLAAIAVTAALVTMAPRAHAATFGSVVPIGGHAADIALDEARGALYVANFGAARIDVVSLAKRAAASSIHVAPFPGSLSLSPDGRFLVVAHFGNFQAPSSSANALTVIDLVSQGQQTLALGDPPLGVAFGADGRALVVTTTQFLRFDPLSGAFQVLDTIAGVTAKTLPVPPANFPPQIVAASVGVSADGTRIYGLSDTIRFRYDVLSQTVYAAGYTADPPQGPRVVSVSRDGSYFTAGWGLFDATGHLRSEFPNPSGKLNVGSHAIDSVAGLIYAQIPQGQPQGNGTSSAPAAAQPPVLMIVDADNLTVREQLQLPENLAGKSLLNSARDTLYAVSDSGVMILPVGLLGSAHRLIASREDVIFRGNLCDRQAATQDLVIADPGGGATDFTLSTSTAGVNISPASGTTPATVHITVDPQSFAGPRGTVTAWLQITSRTAVNLPAGIRVLINNRGPEQRGTIVDVPGKLVDVLADPARDRFYILRQDKNQVLVFDGTTYQQIATLRTANTPTQMAFTFDRSTLLVGHDNSQLAYAYDLNTLTQLGPIYFPPGHYPRSIASSGNATLAASRVAGPVHTIDRIDLLSRRAFTPLTLGMYENNVNINTTLAASVNGASILAAMPDGTVMLYDASADEFIASRQDFASLSGAYAASNYDSYIVDNHLLNASLVPVANLDNAGGSSSGFVFVDQTGYRTTAADTQAPGVMQRVDMSLAAGVNPTAVAEAPLVGQPGAVFTRTLDGLYSRSAFISLTVSGFTAMAWNYDASVAPPNLQTVVSAADGSKGVAPGGLVTVWGSQLSPVNIATSEIPVPTALGESCLTVNGVPVPMLFASPNQINAQLPVEVEGAATMVLHTPGGTSNNLDFTIVSAAPSVFRSGVAGPKSGVATVVRAKNNQLVTPSNPIHRGEAIVIYATGLGRTLPSLATGFAASANPLPVVIEQPDVSLGGHSLPLYYAGLAPGEVGVYQINALVPGWAPTGMQVPLTITQGSVSTTLTVRVID
ncbi:MAG: hypothetical protein LAP39_27830 [Acidobacteriia bacterium]|nr:hypothetical protein [Terriglobia bacterium]